MSRTIPVAILALVAGAAAAAQGPRVLTGAAADLVKANGERIGEVRIQPRGNEIFVIVNLARAAPGRYGVHIHDVGRCSGPGFESAGPHWNPTARHHGRLNPAGHHLGDLPNIEVGPSGRGALRFTINRTLNSLMDADGASVVLHAAADDERTDPSGNSGARLACGPLRSFSV
ncbi:MAG TPA: superoxide dismutase family protein [Allosphingosinicella sp.]